MFTDKLSKMVPQSETKAKIVASCLENKALGTIKLRFRDDHDIWNWTPLVTRCHLSESISWKKAVGRKNLPGRPKAMSILKMSERYQHPNNQPHTGIWSSTVRACSYRYYLMKNNTEWMISTPTTSPCEVWLFELAVIGTILSVMKTTRPHLFQPEMAGFGSKILHKSENHS